MSLHRSVCVYIYKKQRWGDDFQQISQMQNQRYPTNIREGFISNACSNPPNSEMEFIFLSSILRERMSLGLRPQDILWNSSSFLRFFI